MSDSQLTKHFKRSEFECKCCGACNVSARLLTALEQLREDTGRPVHILSGYRCPNHNAQVGGAKSSEHTKGLAADIVIEGLTLKEMLDAVLKVPEFLTGGVGAYPVDHVNGPKPFLHVDVRSQAARWARISGAYVGLGLIYKP